MKKGRIGSVIGALVAGLLLFGSAVGISFGGTDRIDGPMVFDLESRGLKDPAVFNQYVLRNNTQGGGRGFVGTLSIPYAEEAGGDAVARDRASCTDTPDVGVLCSHVWTFEASGSIERGTVTLSGIFRSLENDTVNRYAVTGGTGAYQNVRGYVTERIGRTWLVTFHLTP